MFMLTPVYNLPLNTLNKSFGLGNGVVVMMLHGDMKCISRKRRKIEPSTHETHLKINFIHFSLKGTSY